MARLDRDWPLGLPAGRWDLSGTVIGFDTETRGFNWWNPEQRAFLGTWADADGEYCANLLEPEDRARYERAVGDAETLIAHNLSFDVHQTRATIGLDLLTTATELHDTDLMARVVYPQGTEGTGFGFRLKELATQYLRADAGAAEAHMFELADSIKLKMKEDQGYYDFWRAYPDVMEQYARLDARYTYDLYHHLKKEMDENAQRIYDLERRVAPVLIRAEARGVALDHAPVAKLLREYKTAQAQLHDRLSKELGDEALGGKGSEDALTEALLMVGVPLTEKTETGKLATNKQVLGQFEDQFPVISDLFEFRRVSKFLSTYIEPMVGQDVVHPSFKQVGAWTGRMSCMRPNMQNIPKAAGKEVRSMFVPREGYCFIVVDYEQIEFRLLARWLNDNGLIKLLEDGHDPFAWLAAEIEGGEYEYYRKGQPGEPLRQNCKHTTYAVAYGGGGRAVTNKLSLDPGPWWDEDHPEVVAARARGRDWPKPGWQYAEARKIINKVKKSLPNYYKFAGRNGRVQRKIRDVGYVNTMWGRKQIVKKDKAYVGVDALIQGTAGDIFKEGCYLVDEATCHLGAVPILFVHDEIVNECPIEYADECLELTCKAMCDAADIHPFLAVEGSIVTTNYADA